MELPQRFTSSMPERTKLNPGRYLSVNKSKSTHIFRVEHRASHDTIT